MVSHLAVHLADAALANFRGYLLQDVVHGISGVYLKTVSILAQALHVRCYTASFRRLPFVLMSSAHRLYWLASEIQGRRSAYATFSFNATKGKEKIKFVLQDSYAATSIYRPCILIALTAVQTAIEQSIATDKGHHSDDEKYSIVEL